MPRGCDCHRQRLGALADFLEDPEQDVEVSDATFAYVGELARIFSAFAAKASTRDFKNEEGLLCVPSPSTWALLAKALEAEIAANKEVNQPLVNALLAGLGIPGASGPTLGGSP